MRGATAKENLEASVLQVPPVNGIEGWLKCVLELAAAGAAFGKIVAALEKVLRVYFYVNRYSRVREFLRGVEINDNESSAYICVLFECLNFLN